ncbi:hypothetical protein F6B13_00105 [Salmonella enterica]|nr:hypothetical protein [Salmonella enterica]EKC5485386.1 hypothetical protein [Salmonella enterica]
MGSNIIELAKLGHERAAELKASCGAVDVRSVAQLISDLATQLEVQLVRGNEQAVQLANAESKCREMAAENVALNDKMNKLATWPGIEFYSSAWEFCNLDGNDALEFMCDVKTPATDAFLAEVRAQGVEMFADELLCPDIDDSIREFAAQLRKGAAL